MASKSTASPPIFPCFMKTKSNCLAISMPVSEEGIGSTDGLVHLDPLKTSSFRVSTGANAKCKALARLSVAPSFSSRSSSYKGRWWCTELSGAADAGTPVEAGSRNSHPSNASIAPTHVALPPCDTMALSTSERQAFLNWPHVTMRYSSIMHSAILSTVAWCF